MQLAEDIASALEHCHAQRPPVVHRDLSGRNVLLAGDGRSARLADFGLAAAKRRTYLSSDKVKRWALCVLGCAGRAVQLVAHSGMLPLVCLVLSGLTVPFLFGVFGMWLCRLGRWAPLPTWRPKQCRRDRSASAATCLPLVSWRGGWAGCRT